LTPGCQKKIQQKHSQPYGVPVMIDFAMCTLKDKKKIDVSETYKSSLTNSGKFFSRGHLTRKER